MKKDWTFGQKLTAGYAVMLVLVLLTSAIAIYALRSVVASKDQVITVNVQILLDAEKLHTRMEEMVAQVRGYVISPEERFTTSLRKTREEFSATIARLRGKLATEEERRMLDTIELKATLYRQAAEDLMVLKREQAQQSVIVRAFDEKLLPVRDQFNDSVESFTASQERHLTDTKQAASEIAAEAVTTVIAIASMTALFAIIVAVLLTRALNRQIGAAVGHVQSSSAELQAAASQQASGAKEQASAMTEISTTISELVATSRQIAESAQRVAQIAEQTASSARSGEGTVDKGQDAITSIRRQIDLVVNHMLDLGRKSQEIGAVLDVVSELAEQTNILAINATIEASGAGEAGKRFSVVAEEIRKLADRVANSTKGIRSQIDDVRGAVNTTVMATESGAKAVDAGARQFSDIATAFKQIAALVGTTTDAAREIELSTKQQATAAEQVRLAVTDVAQATQESETSSTQTLQTASQLAGLSMDLRRLIQQNAA
ncbi:MAG: methyl-accepting chemotaxis protein [Pseudomonadota bacterium]